MAQRVYTRARDLSHVSHGEVRKVQSTSYLARRERRSSAVHAPNSPAYLIQRQMVRAPRCRGYPAGLVQAGRMHDVVQSRLPFTPIRLLVCSPGHVLLVAASTQQPQQTDGDAE